MVMSRLPHRPAVERVVDAHDDARRSATAGHLFEGHRLTANTTPSNSNRVSFMSHSSLPSMTIRLRLRTAAPLGRKDNRNSDWHSKRESYICKVVEARAAELIADRDPHQPKLSEFFDLSQGGHKKGAKRANVFLVGHLVEYGAPRR